MTLQHDVDGRIEFERQSVTSSDLEFEPVSSEDEDYVSAPADYKITTYPADFTLEVLHQKWRAAEFQVPEFQRAFVWRQVQSSKLIESFLVGLPVPPVFVYRDLESERHLVIDGQQRLKSIFYFFEGFFGEETNETKKVFRLTGLSPDSRFLGKQYKELREEDQRRLKNAVLRSFVVQQLDPNDDTSMYHIFERLNTGGTLLTNQEIRNCIFEGSLSKSLNDLNAFPEWRIILGKEQPDSRKRDIELMVRFFAMRDLSGYEKPMKDFLSKFMKKNKDAPQMSLDLGNELFRTTCAEIVRALGERPFHLRSGLNVAAADSVMAAFSHHTGRTPDDIRDRYTNLKNDKKFTEAIRQGTTDVETVRERFRRAVEVLFR